MARKAAKKDITLYRNKLYYTTDVNLLYIRSKFNKDDNGTVYCKAEIIYLHSGWYQNRQVLLTMKEIQSLLGIKSKITIE